jgi:hypothetical protein
LVEERDNLARQAPRVPSSDVLWVALPLLKTQAVERRVRQFSKDLDWQAKPVSHLFVVDGSLNCLAQGFIRDVLNMRLCVSFSRNGPPERLKQLVSPIEIESSYVTAF